MIWKRLAVPAIVLAVLVAVVVIAAMGGLLPPSEGSPSPRGGADVPSAARPTTRPPSTALSVSSSGRLAGGISWRVTEARSSPARSVVSPSRR